MNHQPFDRDSLGNAYEYLIKKFADDSGHTAAEFYTNRTVGHLVPGAGPLQALSPSFVLAVTPELGRGAAARLAAAPTRAEKVTQMLARFGGKRDEAAQYLGTSRTTLWRTLRAEGAKSP